MREELLRTLIMTISYAFIGVCLLVWVYLLISALVLRISTRGKTDDVRRKSFEKIFTGTLESDLSLIHRSTRTALLVIAVFLAAVWLFGAGSEQITARSMLGECDRWVCYLMGGGICIGTLLLLVLPTCAGIAQNCARLIRKDSFKFLWIAVLYFVVTWLIS